MNVNRIGEFAARKVLCILHGQSVLSNDFKCLFYINSFFGRCLKIGKIALRLAESHGSLLRDLQVLVKKKCCCLYDRVRTILFDSSMSILFPITTKGKFSLMAISNRNTSIEAFTRITRTRLNEKFVSPAIKGIKALCIIYIIHQHTAICSAIERHAKGLKPLLPSCIP